ncbi:DNA cytosine methyltransferase [Polaromonas sp. UC242_47]|uniref:DNA cytosine methyltransferase n=1 Tax=Polaromonas sp. UC242_47 TaxID=3374626 RepID=UPI00379ED344
MLAITKSKHPIALNVPICPHRPASSFIDFDAGRWSPINKPGRSANTLARIASGRRAHGERFLAPYYGSGSGTTGRSLDRPIGTITTRDRWAVIDGDRMRMLTKDENRAGMGFPVDYVLPRSHKLAVHMLGNAVAPWQGRDDILALKAAL